MKNSINRMVVLILVATLLMAMTITVDAKIPLTETIKSFFMYLLIKPVIRGVFIIIPTYKWLTDEGTSFANNFDIVISYNPPIEGVLPFMDMFLKVLLPLYSLSIVSVGFYLLLCSSSPEGRANAKSLLFKLITTLVLVSLSPQLISVIFAISRDLTGTIFSLTGLGAIKGLLNGGIWSMFVLSSWLMVPDLEPGTIPHMMIFIFAWLPYMIISLRNILLTALMIVFPFGIFLYYAPGLKKMGKTILEQFLLWTFLQAFMALALVSVAKAFSTITLVSNPKITCLNIFPVPGINNMLAWFFTAADLGSTDLMTLGFGATAYIVIILSPVIMVMLFKNFLP